MLNTNSSQNSPLNQRYLERIIPFLVAAVLFMEFLDISIINTAVPSIAHSFEISPILLKFSVASYFLSLAIFIPISGWCADKFGTRRTFLFSVALFTVASLLCGISENIWQLTFFRFLQGIGGAFMNPVARIIVLRLFPAKDIVRIQGIIFTPAMLGYVLGPFLGGMITSYLSWHWIFLINVPAGLLIIYIGYKHIIDYVEPNIKRFDVFGFLLAAISLCLITVFVETLNHYDILTKEMVFLAGVVGVGLFVLLVWRCLKSSFPILDFSLLEIKTFRVGFYINLCMYALNASIAFLLPLMFQENFNLSPAKSGLLTLPLAVGYLIFRGIASKIIHRFGFRRALVVNLVLVLFWILTLSLIGQSTPVYFTVIVLFLLGASTIIVGSSTGALNYVEMPKENTSKATAIDLTFRQFASSMGIGLSSFLLTTLSNVLGINISTYGAKIFHYTFILLTILVIISIINALKLNKMDGIAY